MSSIFARARSTEAPMSGIEFTNRSKTVPAWRINAQGDDANSTATKRSHDTALPPPVPFDPKKSYENMPSSQTVFGVDLHYLFRPVVAQPSNAWAGPPPEIPEVDMKDIELSPVRQPLRSGSGHSNSESAREGRYYTERARGEENESPERRRISNAAVRRIARKRQETRGKNRSRGPSRMSDADDDEESTDNEDYDEDESSRKGRALTRTTSNHYTLNMPGPAPVKSETPYILLGYLQFMFNLSLILVFLYLLVQFIFTVQRDVEQRIGEYSMEILQEITTCAQLYKQNLCDTTPIPAMLHQCATWETCMSRDPKVVGRAKVGAEMLAEVVNGFVEPISWKTLLFTLSSIAFMTVFVNGLVMLYRSRLHPDRHTPPSHAHAPSAMPLQNFAPFHSPYGYLPSGQQSHMTWHPESEMDMLPRQRRRLENGEATALKS